jgi:hypothetical protein
MSKLTLLKVITEINQRSNCILVKVYISNTNKESHRGADVHNMGVTFNVH